MYRYDEFDYSAVNERVEQFRGQVARRLNGDLTEEEFRPLRLMNGLYSQLHAYMLRVAVPYGTLSSRQLRMLAKIARKYDKDYGHFTTRQNIQYNWPSLKDVPDILADLASVEMHAIQTSGNCIRNITADQYAGASADEVADSRIYAEILRQWSTFHPEFSYLPRKFKFAVTGSKDRDRTAVKFHDIGIRVVENDHKKIGFEFMVGGGLGRTPFIGETINDFIQEKDLLSYSEAILRVYNQFGRRDNIYKARIKILVQSVGIEEFKKLVEEEWDNIKDSTLQLPSYEIKKIREYFSPPKFESLNDNLDKLSKDLDYSAEFYDWYNQNTHAHAQNGYSIVNISLKPNGGIPGDATSKQMEIIAMLAEKYSFGEVRITHEQNLVLPHVLKNDLFPLWRKLVEADLETANLSLISDIICCPGLDFCSLATARSIPIAQKISLRFSQLKKAKEIRELRLNISGCINACGHHHVGHIGILGVDKKNEEFYQITLGGNGEYDASIGRILGPAVSADEIVDAIERVIDCYINIRNSNERFIDVYRRVGPSPFKQAVYEYN